MTESRIWLVVWLLASLFTPRAGLAGEASPATILTVNNCVVTAAEFHFWLDEFRARVLSRYAARGLDPNAPDFWAWPVDGSPGAANDITGQAIEEIVRQRVLWGEFERLGLVRKGSFDAVMADRETANRTRQQAIQAGHIVHGPWEWDRASFYHHQTVNLTLALEAAWGSRDEVRTRLQRLVQQAQVQIDQTNLRAAFSAWLGRTNQLGPA